MHRRFIGIRCVADQNATLFLDLYDRRINGFSYEFDSLLAVLLVAIALATDRNRFLVICSEAPAPFASCIGINVEDHDGKVVVFLLRLLPLSAREG